MEWFKNLQTTWATMLEALGAIAIVAGGVSAIVKLLNPYKQLRERMNELEKHVGKHDTLFDKDNRRLQREEEATAITLSSLFALINHTLTGNSRDALVAARDKLQDHLAKR